MTRRFAHWTPHYVRDRLRQRAYERKHPDAPWLTAAMIDILDGWLAPSDNGIEWGSGRSTIWLARRIARLTTVEDNALWAGKVQQMLREHRLGDKVAFNHVPVSAQDHADPAGAAYVGVARTLPAASLDFALVDGDLRDACTAAAIGLLKPGGLLVIDNVERYVARACPTRSPNARSLADGHDGPIWTSLHERLKTWRCIWTSNGVSDTACWVKPG